MSSETFPLRPEMDDQPDEQFKRHSLLALAQELSGRQYPDYPAFRDRAYLPMSYLDLLHPVRNSDAGPGPVIPDPGEYPALKDSGLSLDEWNRPLHPWLEQMVTNPVIGVATGKGFYQQWGPNYTADSVVIKNGHILLVERKDMGTLAVPGGFVDPTDTSAAKAATREVKEETTLRLEGLAEPVQLYEGLVADIRMTAHAWPETTAFLFNLGDDGSPLPQVEGKDDAKRAFWLPIEAVRQAPLFGSHNAIIELALERLVPA